MTGIKLEGGAQLARTLSGLSESVRGDVLRQVLTEVGEPMRATMATLAPRRPPAPDMADHIVITPLREIDSDRLTETEAAVAIGPARRFFYAGFLEYGTVKMRAFPFMRPAFDQHVRPAIGAIASRLWAVLIGRGLTGARSTTGGLT